MWVCVCRCQRRCEWQYRHLSRNRLKTSCFPLGCWHVHRILPKTQLISAFPTYPNWKMLNLDRIHKLQPQYAVYTTCIKVEIQSLGTIAAPALSWCFSTMALVYFPSRCTSRLVKPSNSCILHCGTSDCWSPRSPRRPCSQERCCLCTKNRKKKNPSWLIQRLHFSM